MRRWLVLLTVFCSQPLCLIAQTTAASSPVQTSPKLQPRERYRLHPGDVLVLNYRFTPDFNQSVALQPDGYVNLSIVGSVRLADLTLDEAHDLIVSKASDKLNAPELNLVLKEFVAPSVVVAGEVNKPGKFDLREGTTALQSILLAGGYTDNARAGQVVVIRKLNDTTGEVFLLDLNHILKNKDMERDMALRAGDMVMVPKDRISRISRFIRLANVGIYLNPLDPLLR